MNPIETNTKPKNDGKENIIIEIAKNIKNLEWTIIGGKKKWIRNCPTCNKEISYNYKWTFTDANCKNKKCKSCTSKIEWNIRSRKVYPLNDYTRKCPSCNVDIIYKNRFFKKKADKENRLCKTCHYNKGHTQETKNKIGIKSRERIINKIQLSGKIITPFFNNRACQYFNELNKKNGWNLKYATNGGEVKVIGYFLDAYDKDKNIVVEYDEKHHNFPKKKNKDKIRQENIIKELNCSFYRYNESKKELIKIQ